MTKLKLFVVLCAGCAIAGVSGVPARAQLNIPGLDLGGAAPVDEATRQRRDEVDRNYRATKGTLPNDLGAVDPWAGMRGEPEKKPAQARPAQTRTKTSEKKKPTAH